VPGDFPSIEEAIKIADEARKERLDAKRKVNNTEKLAEEEHTLLQSSDEETPATEEPPAAEARAEGGVAESSDEDLPTLDEIYKEVTASKRRGLR
jgi:hypothetical protein